MKLSVSWKALEKQLESKPGYKALLEKNCPEFANKNKEKVTDANTLENLSQSPYNLSIEEDVIKQKSENLMKSNLKIEKR